MRQGGDPEVTFFPHHLHPLQEEHSRDRNSRLPSVTLNPDRVGSGLTLNPDMTAFLLQVAFSEVAGVELLEAGR